MTGGGASSSSSSLQPSVCVEWRFICGFVCASIEALKPPCVSGAGALGAGACSGGLDFFRALAALIWDMRSPPAASAAGGSFSGVVLAEDAGLFFRALPAWICDRRSPPAGGSFSGVVLAEETGLFFRALPA